MHWTHLLAGIRPEASAPRALKALQEGAAVEIIRATVVPPGRLPATQADDITVLQGLPGVELVRHAERREADLIVLGRHLGDNGHPPRLGPTADAVVRRSARPCLLVPTGQASLHRTLVALDGLDRGMAVLEGALAWRRLTGADLRIITVEPGDHAGDALGATLQVASAREARIRDRLHALDERLPVQVGYGDPVEEIVRRVNREGCDVLVVGAHRGGPSGPPTDSTGVGRGLLFGAPCAVLTVPL